RATARHPGNTAIVHFFAGRDVPGSAWEEPERDEHQLALGVAHPRYAIRTRPAFIRTRGGCSYRGFILVGAPPSVRTGPAHIRTRGGCSYHGFVPVGAPPSVRTGASTFSHPGRVLLPRQVPVGAPPSVRTGASTFSHPGRVLLQRSPHPLHSAGDDAADATYHQPADMGGVGDSTEAQYADDPRQTEHQPGEHHDHHAL